MRGNVITYTKAIMGSSIVSLLLLLSACNGNSVDKVVTYIEEKDYYSAGEELESLTKDKSEEEQKEIAASVSEEIMSYLDKKTEDIKNDDSARAAFFNALEEIEELGIDDEALSEKVAALREEYAPEEKDSIIVEDEESDKTTNTASSSSNADSIFDMDWETFKIRWYNSISPIYDDLDTINDKVEKESIFSMRYEGIIYDGLYVAVNTYEDTEKIMAVSIIGKVDDSKDVFAASANLIKMTDPSVDLEDRKALANYLGLDGSIITDEHKEYTLNGVVYESDYEHIQGYNPTLMVTVELEDTF